MAIDKVEVLKPSRMNNLKLNAYRRELLYEAVMTDLVLMGALPKDVVESFLGRYIVSNVTVPGTVQQPLHTADSLPTGNPFTAIERHEGTDFPPAADASETTLYVDVLTGMYYRWDATAAAYFTYDGAIPASATVSFVQDANQDGVPDVVEENAKFTAQEIYTAKADFPVPGNPLTLYIDQTTRLAWFWDPTVTAADKYVSLKGATTVA